MQIQQNVALSGHSTMRLGGNATYYAEIHNRNELLSAHKWASANEIPVRMIGDGSNIVWRDDGFDGLVLMNRMERYEVFGEDEMNVYLTVGAGENWDSVVKRTVDNHLTGIECLGLIPGTCGATPVQNVGAYGQDISQTLVSVEALDTTTGQFLNIPAMECGFGYRTSRFKTADQGRFYITALTLHLNRGDLKPPFYASLQKYFDDHHVTEFNPEQVRAAVIAIRQSKLPDPKTIANNGSFFANPIISDQDFAIIQNQFPEAPHWPTDTPGTTKVPAAWLLEQCGFKDHHDAATGMGTWPAQTLVLVNEHATSTASLVQYRDLIMASVQAKFGITLNQEPELLGEEAAAVSEPDPTLAMDPATSQPDLPEAPPEEPPAAPPPASPPSTPPAPPADPGPRPDYLDMYNKV